MRIFRSRIYWLVAVGLIRQKAFSFHLHSLSISVKEAFQAIADHFLNRVSLRLMYLVRVVPATTWACSMLISLCSSE